MDDGKSIESNVLQSFVWQHSIVELLQVDAHVCVNDVWFVEVELSDSDAFYSGKK